MAWQPASGPRHRHGHLAGRPAHAAESHRQVAHERRPHAAEAQHLDGAQDAGHGLAQQPRHTTETCPTHRFAASLRPGRGGHGGLERGSLRGEHVRQPQAAQQERRILEGLSATRSGRTFEAPGWWPGATRRSTVAPRAPWGRATRRSTVAPRAPWGSWRYQRPSPGGQGHGPQPPRLQELIAATERGREVRLHHAGGHERRHARNLHRHGRHVELQGRRERHLQGPGQGIACGRGARREPPCQREPLSTIALRP